MNSSKTHLAVFLLLLATGVVAPAAELLPPPFKGFPKCLSYDFSISIPEGTSIQSEILVTIGDNGKVINSELVKSSGVTEFDQVALKKISTCEFLTKDKDGNSYAKTRSLKYKYAVVSKFETIPR